MSRGGITTQIVDNSVVALGDNEFETGLINVPGNSTIKKGTVLRRLGTGKFAPVTDTEEETPIAVNPFDIPNTEAAARDLSIRAIISGPVRADLLLIDGEETTVFENDMLRAYTIIPVKQNDISRTE
jgi:hypothetical protein